MVRFRSPAPPRAAPRAVLVYGGIPEWPKGADCKSVVTDFDGPNPSSPTRKKHLRKQVLFSTKSADGGRNPPAVDEIAAR